MDEALEELKKMTIYTLVGVWCPAGCGSYTLFYVAPAYGQAYQYHVWCPNCLKDVV